MKSKDKDGKPLNYPDKNSRTIPMTIMFLVLCGFSFHLGRIFCSEKNRIATSEAAVETVPSSKEATSSPLQIKPVPFADCGSDFQDYTPCTDPKRLKKYGTHRLTFLERHCPPIFERRECLVPPPDGYKPPIRWPKSKKECCHSKNQIKIG